MKEWHLLTLDYPPERGGVACYLGNLVEASNGMIRVLVPETHAISGPGCVENARCFWRGPIAWLPMVWTLWRHRRVRAILVSHLLPVGTAAFLARWVRGAPYVVLVHGLDILLAQTSAWKRWLAGRVLRSASAVVANSEAIAQRVRETWPDVFVRVITPGVSIRTFLSREDARTKLGVPQNEKLCLTVARLEPRKGIDRMIEALSSFPEMIYIVIGEGHDRARLEALAETHASGRVRFVGACSDEDRDLWFAAADVCTFLAREEVRDIEGFGIVCLEAALARLPVLAGRSGGLAEAVVHEETGLLVDPHDLTAIRAALTRLFEDGAFRTRLGEAGRIRALRDFRLEDRWKRFQELV